MISRESMVVFIGVHGESIKESMVEIMLRSVSFGFICKYSAGEYITHE